MKPPGAPRTETEIVAAILDALRRTVPGCWMRMNSRMVELPGKGGRRRLVRMGGAPGMSDIIGCLAPEGWWASIEVKRPRPGGDGPLRPPSLEQIGFLDWIRYAGGLALVTWSVPHALDGVHAYLRLKRHPPRP